MGLQEDLAAVLAALNKADRNELKTAAAAIEAANVALLSKRLDQEAAVQVDNQQVRTFKGLAQLLADQTGASQQEDVSRKIVGHLKRFISGYEAGVGAFWSGGKSLEHVAPLKLAVQAFEQAPTVNHAYEQALDKKKACQDEWEEKLSAPMLNINTTITKHLKLFVDVVDPKQPNARGLLLDYADLITENALIVHKRRLSIEVEQGESSTAIAAVAASLEALLSPQEDARQLQSLLAEVQRLCLEQRLPQEIAKLTALKPLDDALSVARNKWRQNLYARPQTWAAWNELIATALRHVRGDRTSLESIQDIVASNAAKEHGSLQAQLRTQEGVANIRGRKVGQLQRKLGDMQDFDLKSVRSGASGMSAYTAYTDYQLSGGGTDPMDDFYRMAKFWHPSRIMVVNILSTQLRELAPPPLPEQTLGGDSGSGAAPSRAGSDEDMPNGAAPHVDVAALRGIIKALIMEEITPFQGVKQYKELPGASKTVASSTLMINFGIGLLDLSNTSDPHPGMDAEVSDDVMQAYQRSEKLATITTALKDRSSASLLPYDEGLASELNEVVSDITARFPQVSQPSFQRSAEMAQLNAGRREFRGLATRQTLAQASVAPRPAADGPATPPKVRRTGEGGGVHASWQLQTPTRGVTGAVRALSLNGEGPVGGSPGEGNITAQLDDLLGGGASPSRRRSPRRASVVNGGTSQLY